jgi:hypothetical protein
MTGGGVFGVEPNATTFDPEFPLVGFNEK